MFYLLVFLFTQYLLFLPLLEIMLSFENIKIKQIPAHMEITVYILYDIIKVNLKKKGF